MDDNQKEVQVTKAGLISIGIITIVLLVTLFFIFSKLNVFPGNGLLVYSIAVPVALGLLFIVIFMGIKAGAKINPIVKNELKVPVIKSIFNIVNNIYFIWGLLYFCGVSLLGYKILHKAMAENDYYAVTVGVIALIVGSVLIWALIISYVKAKKLNSSNFRS